MSTPSLAAAQACSAPGAVAEAAAAAARTAAERDRLQAALTGLGIEVAPGSQAPYLLCRAPGHPYVRERLRELGIAVRRGDTFPGLTGEHWRTAVRDRASSDRLAATLCGRCSARSERRVTPGTTPGASG